MLRNGRTFLHKCGSHCGCSCCNTRRARRAQTHALRQLATRTWRRQVARGEYE